MTSLTPSLWLPSLSKPLDGVVGVVSIAIVIIDLVIATITYVAACRRRRRPIVLSSRSSFRRRHLAAISFFISFSLKGGALKLCQDMDLTLLGRLPLDPRIGQSCDEGRSFLDVSSPATEAFVAITNKILEILRAEDVDGDEMDLGEDGR